MTSPDLFEGMAVDYGRPRPSLADGRKLLEDIEALGEVEWDVDSVAIELAKEARKLGAHSVWRVLVWFASSEAFERHGGEHLEIRAERVAKRWLERQERARAGA